MPELERAIQARRLHTAQLKHPPIKPLHATKDGSVYHDSPVFLSILSDVVYIEPFGQVEIHLNCWPPLPETAERILELGIDLWAVKHALTWIYGILKPVAF